MTDTQKTITQTTSMSSIKNYTPAKPFGQTSLTNLQSSVQKPSAGLAMKASFKSFLERNTPSKLTKTELDEKRRAELHSKDTKEKERMQELERQKNEKREEARKIRDDRLKKAAEQKLQRDVEFKQKAEQKKAEEEAKLAEFKQKNASAAHSLHTTANTTTGSHTSQPVKKTALPQAVVILPTINLPQMSTNRFDLFKNIETFKKYGFCFYLFGIWNI